MKEKDQLSMGVILHFGINSSDGYCLDHNKEEINS